MQPLEDATLDHAITNMRHFMAELIETFGELNWQYIGGGDKPRHQNGWFGFEIVLEGEIIAIDMAGCDPQFYSPEGDMFAAPQIYVNGSQWQYGIALTRADEEIRNIIIDNWIRNNKS